MGAEEVHGAAVEGAEAGRTGLPQGAQQLCLHPLIVDVAARSGITLRCTQGRRKEKIVHVEQGQPACGPPVRPGCSCRCRSDRRWRQVRGGPAGPGVSSSKGPPGIPSAGPPLVVFSVYHNGGTEKSQTVAKSFYRRGRGKGHVTGNRQGFPVTFLESNDVPPVENLSGGKPCKLLPAGLSCLICFTCPG